MRILHIALSGPYTDGFSYQENLLAKYHHILGYDTYVLASEWMYDKSGQLIKATKNDYICPNGIHVIRLPLIGKDNINKRIRVYKNIKKTIEDINPDIIFHHGTQNVDELLLAKICKKNPNIKLFMDNHSDYSNSASNFISKYFLHGILWRFCAHRVCPYVQKFYGVLPSRVDFLIDLYKLPKEKVELLVMGADDELVEKSSRPNSIETIKNKYGIDQDDFFIVNGGKIDQWKKQTLLLMDAVNKLDNPHIKLLVFGSVSPELKFDVEKRCSDRVKYIGWIDSNDSYDIFASADVVCFPGRHSVFWEQVAGQGIPMICKSWAGTKHVDCGGNVVFLNQDSVDEIIKAISECKLNYNEMNKLAKKCQNVFRYSEISKLSINCEK